MEWIICCLKQLNRESKMKIEENKNKDIEEKKYITKILR